MGKLLTTKAVMAATAPGEKRVEIADAALVGLYLVVQPSGGKSWAMRYRLHGKPSKLTLGRVLYSREDDEAGEVPIGQPMTLQEARAAARRVLQELAEGKDPAAAKKRSPPPPEKPERDLVETLAGRFIERACKPTNKSWEQTQRQFDVEIIPVIGDKRVQDVTKRDVLDLLDAIVERGSPVTSNRVFATLRRFFGWLVERDVIPVSPMGGMKKQVKEQPRTRVLSDAEIRWFWQATGRLGPPFGPLFRMLLITGQRRDEVGRMRRREISATPAPVWTLPSERVKNKREHVVPLPDLALETIDQCVKVGKAGYVFTTNGETPCSGFSKAKDRVDAYMLELARAEAVEAGEDPDDVEIAPWTLHDLRRTMASQMAGLRINLAVIEKAINHISGSFGGIVAVYQRHEFADEKREALTRWADHLAGLVGDKAPSNVVVLEKHAS